MVCRDRVYDVTGQIVRHRQLSDGTVLRESVRWFDAEPGHPGAVDPGTFSEGWFATEGEWPPPGDIVPAVAVLGPDDATTIDPLVYDQAVAAAKTAVDNAGKQADKQVETDAARRTKLVDAIQDPAVKAAMKHLGGM